MGQIKNCTICNIEVEGNYCTNCGQDVNNPETTFKSMLSDLVSSVLDVEKSVFSNIFSLVISPKKLVFNYWNGNRKYYPSPFKVLIYALAIAALHLSYVNPEIMGVDLDTEGIDSQVSFWIIILPLLTVTSYLTFIRRKFSFTKHLISILYIAGCFFIVLILLGDLIYLTTGFDFAEKLMYVFVLFVFIWNSFIFSKSKGIGFRLLNTLIQLVIFLIIVGVIFSLLLMIPGAVILNK